MRKSVTDILRETDETLFSFEVLPPVKGKSIELIYCRPPDGFQSGIHRGHNPPF